MTRRTALQFLAGAPLVCAQDAVTSAIQPIQPPDEQDYVCPMDSDVRSSKPGTCPRCGMKLMLGIPDQVEYPMNLKIQPSPFHAGNKVELAFKVLDPKTGKQVKRFEIVHERLFHLFIVAQDLQYFVHDHPEFGSDAIFRYQTRFPHSGMFRLLGDFYPSGGVPQLITKTVIIPGGVGGGISLGPPKLAPDMGPSHCENMDVSLTMEPAQPLAGFKTLMFFHLEPGDGLEKYLGAWAHMLAASDDTIDMIHQHPFIADGGPQLQFNMIFPRANTYRIWVQFQRKGVVNTAVFTVPVAELK